jgi:hypothetical protein
MSDPAINPVTIPVHSLPSTLPPLHNLTQPSRPTQKVRSNTPHPRLARASSKVKSDQAQTDDEDRSSEEEESANTHRTPSKQRGVSVAPVRGREEELQKLTSLEPGTMEAAQELQAIAENGCITPGSKFSLSQDLDLLVVVFQHFWTKALGMFISILQIEIYSKPKCELLSDGCRKPAFGVQSCRFRINRRIIAAAAVNTHKSRYNTFQIINYPDSTAYPEEPRDLKRSWKILDQGAPPEDIDDSLAFHLIHAVLVGQLDAENELKRMMFTTKTYGKFLPLSLGSLVWITYVSMDLEDQGVNDFTKSADVVVSCSGATVVSSLDGQKSEPKSKRKSKGKGKAYGAPGRRNNRFQGK